MFAPAQRPEPALPEPNAPRAIRDRLIDEEVDDFDREYRQVMAEAAETLDLTNVVACLRRWEIVARSSENPEAHRRMLDHARRLRAGEQLPTEPWSVTKARLGL